MKPLGIDSSPKGGFTVRFNIALGVIDTFAVALRLAARWRTKAKFAVDDWWIVWSLTPQYGMIALTIIVTTYGGMGISTADLEPQRIETFLKALMATVFTYALTITSVKISLLLLYRRIFDTQAFKRRSLVVGIACLVWFLIVVLTTFFQCRPFTASFDAQALFSDSCVDIRAYYLSFCILNLFLDVVLLLLPLHMVWGLQLRLHQRISLSGIFSVGLLVCVAGSVRLTYLTYIGRKGDITVYMADEYLWSCIEPAVAIVCASAVTWRPLFINMKIRFSTSLSSFLGRGKLFSDQETDTETLDLVRHDRHKFPASGGLGDAGAYQAMHTNPAKNDVQVVELAQPRLGSITSCKATKPKERTKRNRSPGLMVNRNIEVVTDSWGSILPRD